MPAYCAGRGEPVPILVSQILCEQRALRVQAWGIEAPESTQSNFSRPNDRAVAAVPAMNSRRRMRPPLRATPVNISLALCCGAVGSSKDRLDREAPSVGRQLTPR